MAIDILLEIGVEEVPAKFMPGALSQLEEMAKTKLAEARIDYNAISTIGTPRRLTLIIKGVGEMQADRRSENKGPSLKIAFDDSGNPTKAAQGFARGQGVDVASLISRDGYVYALIEEKGRPVQEQLPAIMSDIIGGFSFPKNMRWGNLDMRFARPIRWLLALYGSEVIPFTIAEVASGSKTYGHRFLSTGEIAVTGVEDYLNKLADHFVIVDPEQRRAMIRAQIETIALSQGGSAGIDEDLLEEVLYLVEYPTALCGTFEEAYLALPPEAVITPMREHQRYFPVFSPEGKLLPLFITVRNGGSEYLNIVRRGNERVLKARLADARFFFEEDQKVKLSDRVEKLKTIVFQEGLGSLYDKTGRIKAMALALGRNAGFSSEELATVEQAAYLAKADLVTGMVCEFTELQGIMGREYAKQSGESEAVGRAIYEHYLPRFAGDDLPSSAAGQVISIADKMDNIVATFSRGLIPTGSQDPFALRRQALGIVNILIQGQYQLSLHEMAINAMSLLGITNQGNQEKLSAEIGEFFRLRVRNVLADEKIRHDLMEAVMAAGTDNVYDLWLRARALAAFSTTPSMQAAVQAFTRAGNLAKNASAGEIDPSLFTSDAEKELYEAYGAAKEKIDQYFSGQDYDGVLEAMAQMATPIDAFFSAVMVMVEDAAIRDNRVALLKAIATLGSRIGDLNKITGQ